MKAIRKMKLFRALEHAPAASLSPGRRARLLFGGFLVRRLDLL